MSASLFNKTLSRDHADADSNQHESKKSHWQTFATFVVSLQSRQNGQSDQRTIAYFLEADKHKVWPGIECDGVYELMQAQLKQLMQVDLEGTAAMHAMPEGQPQVIVETPSATNTISDIAVASSAPISDLGVEKLPPKLNGEEYLPEFESQIFSQAESEPDELPELQAKENVDTLAETPESTVAEDLAPIEIDEVSKSVAENKLLSKGGSLSEQETTQSVTLSTANDDSDSSDDEVSESIAEEALDASETNDISEPVAEEELDPESESQPSEEMEEPVTLKITHLKIHQLLEEGQEIWARDAQTEKAETEEVMFFDSTRPALPDKLPKERPFDLEVIFQLSGNHALELTKQSFPYHTEVYGQNRITREKLTLGETPIGKLINGELTYSCRLTDVTMPQPGSYSLQIITRLDGAAVSADLLELPFVQVA